MRELERNFIYPSTHYYKYQIGFEKLPYDLKLYLEEAVGNEPFDVIWAIEQNNLTAD